MSEKEDREAEYFSKITYTILLSGEAGLDLGPYRDAIFIFQSELFPYTTDEDERKETFDYALINDWEAVVVALDQEKVVGYGSICRLRDGNMNLDTAFVDPDYRRQGIYKKLIEERIEIASQKGAERVTVEALGTNVAQSSLERYGFRRIDDPLSVGEIRYEKSLD